MNPRTEFLEFLQGKVTINDLLNYFNWHEIASVEEIEGMLNNSFMLELLAERDNLNPSVIRQKLTELKEALQATQYQGLTKKEFFEFCSVHVYGRGKGKINAIFFDYTEKGYKWSMHCRIENGTLADLKKAFYEWVVKGSNPEWWFPYRVAQSDEQRFKVPISSCRL